MPKGLEVERRETAKSLYLAGLKTEEICTQVPVKSATLRTWIHRGSWAQEKAALRATLGAVGKQCLAVQVARDLAAESQAVRESLSTALRDQAESLARMKAPDLGRVYTRSKALKETTSAATQVYGWDRHTGSGGFFASLNACAVQICMPEHPPDSMPDEAEGQIPQSQDP